MARSIAVYFLSGGCGTIVSQMCNLLCGTVHILLMDISRINQPLNQFVNKASKSIKVNEVIVFGSYLEGNATEESDIDVVVVSDDFKNLDEDQRLDFLYDAADDIEPIVHPWGFTKEELKAASHLTLLGYARDHGIHFDPLTLSAGE